MNKKYIIILSGTFFVALIIVIIFFLFLNKYNKKDYEYHGFLSLPTLKPIWERKLNTTQILKIGIITDTHIHPKRINDNYNLRELSSRDKNIFNKFNTQMKIFRPEIIIHLGDIIEGTNDSAQIGIKGIELVKEELKKLNIPVHWALGNHELRSVTKEQYKKILNLKQLNQVIDINDYRLIILDANHHKDGSDVFPGKGYKRGHLTRSTLNWLEYNLKTDKRVVVFMHQPAFNRDMEGEKGLPKKSIDNADKLRKLLEKYNVEALFSGHIEVKFYEEKNGVKYYSLTGTKKSKIYPESYYELIVNKNLFKIKMFYSDTKLNKQIDIIF